MATTTTWLLWLTLFVATQASQESFRTVNDWNLDTLPNPNATGHRVFNTVSSLLQHWPNTIYHNGHTIVPGIIPTGTLLYHGRTDPDAPTAREWVSTDPELARLFCFTEGWLLTLITTRPLRVLYFDGSSATKIPDGLMDTQDLLAWGAVMPERANLEWEYERLFRLCDSYGFDAFVRMQLNFEMMLCDFTHGVQTVSLTRLQEEDRFPHHGYSFIYSSVWHDHFPGETRVHLDLTQLVSLYDTALAPSLVAHRAGQPRRAHRVLGIDRNDTDAILARVRAMQPSTPSSGIDWRALFQVLKDRYATRLEVLQSTLHKRDEKRTAERAFRLLITLLAPYLVHSAVPPAEGSETTWAAPVFRLCATTHTAFPGSARSLFTASEDLLLDAVQATNREICRTLVRMWAAGVLHMRDSEPETTNSDPALLRGWRNDIDRLLSWLEWDSAVACRPACAFDEMCYLLGAPKFSMGDWNNTAPHPHCIRVFEPYSDLPEDVIFRRWE